MRLRCNAGDGGSEGDGDSDVYDEGDGGPAQHIQSLYYCKDCFEALWSGHEHKLLSLCKNRVLSSHIRYTLVWCSILADSANCVDTCEIMLSALT